MSSLEYYGINKENVEKRVQELFGNSQRVVVSRANDYQSEKELLLSFKSNNNDVCLNNIATEITRVFSIPRMDAAAEGKYLVLRQN